MQTENFDEEQLGREVTLRNNFERHLQDLAADVAMNVSDYRCESELIEFLICNTLKKQDWVLGAAVVAEIPSGALDVIVVSDPGSLQLQQRLTSQSSGTANLVRSVRNRQFSNFHLEQTHDCGVDQTASKRRIAIVLPCFGPSRPTSLVVITDDSLAVYRSILQTAAFWIGTFVGLYNREKSYRNAISMMSHMSAGYVEVAHFHLDRIDEALNCDEERGCANLKEHLKSAKSELRNAQTGMRRAAVWSADGTPFKEDVCIKDELDNVVKSLGLADLTEKSGWETCISQLSNIRISASKLRLQQSLRDALVGTWILSQRKPIRLQAEVDLGAGGVGRTRLWLHGEGSTISGQWTDEDVKRTFFDPDIFCLTSTSGIVERALTFDCTRRLFHEMRAEMTPRLSENRFSLLLEFSDCRTGK